MNYVEYASPQRWAHYQADTRPDAEKAAEMVGVHPSIIESVQSDETGEDGLTKITVTTRDPGRPDVPPEEPEHG